ncbi:MAG: hypothetical protein HY537_07095 [Deltaproteobacteria bacterium]|nr:hypothetical protein [Deltaproteobacteria bacterium]
MKKSEISFRHFGGSGPLSVYWYPGPYGVAVEATRGRGVGWFSPSGELLGVEFDDVDVKADSQTIEFRGGYSVSVRVKNGKATATLHRSKRKKAA